MSFTPPTIRDFKERFNGDFPYGEDQTRDDIAQDREIIWAIEQAQYRWNQNALPQENLKEPYLLMAAHILVLRLRQRAQGFFSNWEWMTVQNVAGASSLQYMIPKEVKNDPIAQWLSTTRYGVDYLTMVWGNRFAARTGLFFGRTTP